MVEFSFMYVKIDGTKLTSILSSIAFPATSNARTITRASPETEPGNWYGLSASIKTGEMSGESFLSMTPTS